MIERSEMLRQANAIGLRANVVEKDYVLGWLLHAINCDPLLAGQWVFKGGTCLKKCYFETYRFSEDLDFTCLDEAQIEDAFLRERFSAIGAWLYEETGIELPVELLRFDVWTNDRGRRAGQGRIAYRGPVAPRGGDLPRIKLDLTADETLVLAPATMAIAHPYSDMPEGGMTAICYAYPEVFGEKVRALGERARPRDLYGACCSMEPRNKKPQHVVGRLSGSTQNVAETLAISSFRTSLYDVINLFRNGDFTAAASAVRDVLLAKCRFKGIGEPTLKALERFRDELAGDWATMLAHQLPALPPVEAYWNALPEFFAWLSGAQQPLAVGIAPYRLDAGELVLRTPLGRLPIHASISAIIESIRFAGANRLTVELDYTDEAGRRATRVIEPYSLRRTRDGSVVLHAVRTDNQQHRSYRTDRIRGARVLGEVFAPRYAIELTPSGPQRIPDTTVRVAPIGFRVQQTPGLRSSPFGLTYIFSCPFCSKRFQRQSMNAELRPHKSPDGWSCSGRHGLYEEAVAQWDFGMC